MLEPKEIAERLEQRAELPGGEYARENLRPAARPGRAVLGLSRGAPARVDATRRKGRAARSRKPPGNGRRSEKNLLPRRWLEFG
jgi:hypothetical protein